MVDLRDLLQTRFGGEQVERGVGGGAGEGVGHESWAMHQGLGRDFGQKGFKDVRPRQSRGQRHGAAGQALAEAEDIGRDAGLFAGEQRAGAAEADKNLVGDQQHAVALQASATRRNVSAE